MPRRPQEPLSRRARKPRPEDRQRPEPRAQGKQAPSESDSTASELPPRMTREHVLEDIQKTVWVAAPPAEPSFEPTHRVTYWFTDSRDLQVRTVDVHVDEARVGRDEAGWLTVSERGGRWHWRRPEKVSAFEVNAIGVDGRATPSKILRFHVANKATPQAGSMEAAWIRGFASALATAMELNHDEGTTKYALRQAGIRKECLKAAGVYGLDLRRMLRAIKRGPS